MTKKTKKSPARKSRKKTAVDLETSADWIRLGKGTLSIRALSDAEKVAFGSTLEEQVASLTQRIATLESFNVRLQELEDAAGGIWQMIDGTRIAVRQMSDNHLKNAIKLLEQRNSGSPMILKMRAEQQRRVNDQAWAKKDGNLSSNVEMDLVMKQLDKLTMTKTDVASGRDMATVKGALGDMERDVRAQNLRLRGVEKTLMERGIKFEAQSPEQASVLHRVSKVEAMPGFHLFKGCKVFQVGDSWRGLGVGFVVTKPTVVEVYAFIQKVTS